MLQSLFIIIIITFQSLPGGPVEPAASDKHSVGRSPADNILNTIGWFFNYQYQKENRQADRLFVTWFSHDKKIQDKTILHIYNI